MIPVKHIDPDDLALYAMQLLSPDETADMTLHLQHSAEARRVLAEFQGDLSLYAMSAEMHSPPSPTRDRLMKQVGKEKKAIPASLAPQQYSGLHDVTEMPVRSILDEEPKKTAAAKVLPWLGWAAAAAFAFVAGNLYQQKEQMVHTVATVNSQVQHLSAEAVNANTVLEAMKDPKAVRVTLTTGEKPAPQGRASYVVDKGALVFLASNLEPLQTYKTYELWLIPADGRDPIPAGTFQPDAKGNASVILPELPRGVVAKAFGVTIEDAGGSQAPTLPIIMKGAAS
jgi:anti-sigma-K factor RskA